MIARVNGQVVLVSGAIPGERVTARVERVSKSVAYAETVTADEPSSDRRRATGDPMCGGSLYSHIAYPRQLEIKSQVIADALVRYAGFPRFKGDDQLAPIRWESFGFFLGAAF